jgi:hypothetical protein
MHSTDPIGVAKSLCDSAPVTPAVELAFLTLRSTTSSSAMAEINTVLKVRPMRGQSGALDKLTHFVVT